MGRRLLVFLAIVSLFVTTAASALAADNVQRVTIPYSETHTLALGPLAECAGGPGTVTIEAEGTVTITRFADGPHAGDSHVLGQETAAFTIVTDGGTTFTGTFEVRYNARFAAGEAPASPPRVGMFHYRATGTNAATGEALQFTFHGHFVLDRDGMLKVMFSQVNCIK